MSDEGLAARIYKEISKFKKKTAQFKNMDTRFKQIFH